MEGSFVEDDAVLQSWEGRDLVGVDFGVIGFEDLVELMGAGVAVLVLADIDEESAREIS